MIENYKNKVNILTTTLVTLLSVILFIISFTIYETSTIKAILLVICSFNLIFLIKHILAPLIYKS